MQHSKRGKGQEQVGQQHSWNLLEKAAPKGSTTHKWKKTFLRSEWPFPEDVRDMERTVYQLWLSLTCCVGKERQTGYVSHGLVSPVRL